MKNARTGTRKADYLHGGVKLGRRTQCGASGAAEGEEALIDKETAITHLQIINTWAGFALEKDMNFFTKKTFQDIEEWTMDAVKLLREQPEVIRCKDCKCMPTSPHEPSCWKNRRRGDDGNWFCADGIRKDEVQR